MLGLGDLAAVGIEDGHGAGSFRWYVTIAGGTAPIGIFRGYLGTFSAVLLYRTDDGQDYTTLAPCVSLDQAARAGAEQFLKDCGQ